MDKTIALLGGDERMRALSRLYAEEGENVCTWGIAGGENPQALCDAVTSEVVILPLPLQNGGRLSGTEIEISELWRLLRPTQRIFAGGVREEDARLARVHGLSLSDYLQSETLAVRNAVPTAEGAVETAMRLLPVTLHGTEVLVVGFGRIGKLLAHDLQGLGARVSVSARKLSDLAWVDAFGYRGLHTNHLAGELGRFRAVFNTVPHTVFDERRLSELPGECLLIELASVAGFDPAAVEKLRMNYIKASGLPGKVAPESAARAIKAAIEQQMEDKA